MLSVEIYGCHFGYCSILLVVGENQIQNCSHAAVYRLSDGGNLTQPRMAGVMNWKVKPVKGIDQLPQSIAQECVPSDPTTPAVLGTIS